MNIEQKYMDIMHDAKNILAKESIEIQDIVDKLRHMERLKYMIAEILVEHEKLILEAKGAVLEEIISDSEMRYKKVLNSSTLTTLVLESKCLKEHGRYRKLQELLRNIRGSIDTTRSILSAEKSLLGIQNYT